MEPVVKKIRKANFSQQEVSVLLTELQQHRGVLMAKLQNGTTNKKKQELWNKIATAVSNVGQNLRSADELKKKWTDMKTQALRCKGHLKGTGGGPPMKEPPFVELVLDIIGENSELNGVENAPIFDSWGGQTITCINVDLGSDFAAAPESLEQKVVLVETEANTNLAREMPIHNTEDVNGTSDHVAETDTKACCSLMTGADDYSVCSSSQASAFTTINSVVASNSRSSSRASAACSKEVDLSPARKQKRGKKMTESESSLYDKFLEEHIRSQKLYQDYLSLKMKYLHAKLRRHEASE